jgi:hypothetical protein
LFRMMHDIVPVHSRHSSIYVRPLNVKHVVGTKLLKKPSIFHHFSIDCHDTYGTIRNEVVGVVPTAGTKWAGGADNTPALALT